MTKTPKELTKEWRAGKLDLGYYYTKYKSRVIGIQNNFIDDFPMQLMNPVVQVIAPVPTYEEYKAMQERIADQRAELESARWYQTVQNEDIGKLHGLLKECKNIVAHECWQEAEFPDGQVVQRQDLLTRINAALNETQANSVPDIKIQESEEK